MGDAELRLIIAACRAAFAGELRKVEMPGASIDWDRVISLARRHRVQGLCWSGFQSLHEDLPSTTLSLLRQDAEAIALNNLQFAAEAARLLAIFRNDGLDVLFLKGLALAALAYPEPLMKMSLDMDLLVSEGHIARAANLLRSAGYEALIPRQASDVEIEGWHRTRKESVWLNSKLGIQVDLHSRLADNPAMLRHVGLHSPRACIPVAGGIELPTLGRDEQFAYLAVHGASSAWFRLKWITDLTALVGARTCEDIEQLYGKAIQLGAGRAAAQALLLAHHIYGLDLGEPLRSQLGSSVVNKWLVRVAEREMLKSNEPLDRPLGTLMIHLSQLPLMGSVAFAFGEVRRQLRDALPWRRLNVSQ